MFLEFEILRLIGPLVRRIPFKFGDKVLLDVFREHCPNDAIDHHNLNFG
jgi:hypothetical protein